MFIVTMSIITKPETTVLQRGMNKSSVVDTDNGVLLNQKEKGNEKQKTKQTEQKGERGGDS